MADWLANHAHSKQIDLHILIEPPPESMAILCQDLLRVKLKYSLQVNKI